MQLETILKKLKILVQNAAGNNAKNACISSTDAAGSKSKEIS